MSINIGKAVAYLELDTSKFASGLTRAKNDLKVFGDSSATASQKLLGMSSAVGTVGTMLTKSVSVPLATVGALSIKTASQFEAGMSQVKAISGATGTQFEKLNQKAIEMGAKTKFSASESAQAFKYMAMAGWDANEMISGIEGTMNLAAASGEDLALVSDIVTDSLTAFGLSASDAAHFSDVLAQTSARSNTNVSLMGETFQYVAPVAGALGYSVEDTAVAIGLMANSGIKASQAGTALRSIFTNLADPTKEVKEAMEQYNISLTDAEGNMKPLSTLMVELRDRFAGLSEAQKTQLASTLAGKYGMSGLLAVVNASQTDFDNLTKSINNVDGASERMSKTMLDNTQGSLTLMKSAAESTAIIIGNKLKPSFDKVVKSATSMFEKFNKLSDAEQTQIVKIGGIVTAVGPAMMIGSKALTLLAKGGSTIVKFNGQLSLFTQAIGLFASGEKQAALQCGEWFSAMSKVGTGLVSFISSPAGLATLAVVGLTAAFVVNQNQMKSIRDEASALSESEQALSDAINSTYESYNSLHEATQSSITSANQEATAQQALWEKLQGVVDENGRVISGKEVYAQVIVGQLSDALGQEITLTGNQIDGYAELSQSIEQVIANKKALAIQESLKEEYTQALSNQVKASVEYNNALIAVADTQSKVNQKQKEYDEALQRAMLTGNTMSYEVLTMGSELDGLKTKLSNQKSELDKSRQAMVGYNQTIENYNGLSGALIEGDAQKIEEALLKVQNSFQTANTGTAESLAEQQKEITQSYQDMQEALNSGTQGITQEMVDGMKSLADQANTELTNRIAQDKENLKQQFASLGTEVPNGLIMAMGNKSPEIQAQTVSLLTNVTNGVQLKKGEIQTAFTNLGIEAPSGLVQELANKQPDVQAKAIALCAQLQYGEQSKRGEVLSQFKGLGISVDDSVAGGIKSNESKVTSVSGSVGKSGNQKMQSEMSKKLKSPDVDNNTTQKAKEEGNSAWSALKSIFSKSITANIVTNVKTLISGSHANGLDYVPYNGYIAELHQGERVLTKQENERYNRDVGSGKSGDTFIFYNTQPNPYEYARQMKKAKRERESGF